MRKLPWWSMSFLWYAFLLTLAIGSGGWTVVRDLYFYLKGESAPSGALPTFLYICSIAAVWVLWIRERRVANPKLLGEAFDFMGYGQRGSGQSLEGQWHAYTEMMFQLYLCNTRPIATVVRSIQLDGSRLTPPLTIDWPNVLSRRNEVNEAILFETELHHGIAKTFKIQADATVYGFKDVPSVSMDKLVIRVQDSFGNWHTMKIRAGATIKCGL
jgi:hypothetical protein